MAQFIQTELLQFAGVPDVGSAEDIAEGKGDFRLECAECGVTGNALREVEGGDILCPDCEEARDKEDDEPAENQQQLDDLDADGESDESEVCEACGKEPAYELQEAGDGRRVCIVCQDDIDNRSET